MEVAVALAIVGMAFGYGYRTLSGALERLGRDSNTSNAVLFAQSTLDRVGYDIPLGEAELSGNTRDGFTWLIEIRALRSDNDRQRADRLFRARYGRLEGKWQFPTSAALDRTHRGSRAALMRRASSQAGFTLIEMLIGITLLAMLGALIASGTRLGSRSWSSAERRSAGSDDVMLVQSFFRRTIAQAAPVFATEDPRDMTIDFSGGPDTLTLMAPQPGTQSAGLWVQERFYVGQHGGHRDLFVRLRFDPSLPAAAPDPVTLLEGVSQVRFAYFGAAGSWCGSGLAGQLAQQQQAAGFDTHRNCARRSKIACLASIDCGNQSDLERRVYLYWIRHGLPTDSLDDGSPGSIEGPGRSDVPARPVMVAR